MKKKKKAKPLVHFLKTKENEEKDEDLFPFDSLPLHLVFLVMEKFSFSRLIIFNKCSRLSAEHCSSQTAFKWIVDVDSICIDPSQRILEDPRWNTGFINLTRKDNRTVFLKDVPTNVRLRCKNLSLVAHSEIPRLLRKYSITADVVKITIFQDFNDFDDEFIRTVIQLPKLEFSGSVIEITHLLQLTAKELRLKTKPEGILQFLKQWICKEREIVSVEFQECSVSEALIAEEQNVSINSEGDHQIILTV